jgi:hypothetical protein
LNNLAPALAGGAHADLGELAKDASLGPAHLAGAPAGLAIVESSARLVPRARATLASFQPVDLDLAFGAEDRFLEGEDYAVL